MQMSAALMWDNPVKHAESLAGQSPVPSAARIRMQSDQSRLLSLAEEAHAGDACLPAARSPDAQLNSTQPVRFITDPNHVCMGRQHPSHTRTLLEQQKTTSDRCIQTKKSWQYWSQKPKHDRHEHWTSQKTNTSLKYGNYWLTIGENTLQTNLHFDEIIFMYWKISQKYIFWLFLT